MKDGRQEGRTYLFETNRTVETSEMTKLQPKQGENMMMRKILLQSKKEVEIEPKKIKRLFKRKCKIKGNYCDLVIDGGRSQNLVST